MTIDSISNLLTILRNAVTIKKSLVSLPYTKTNYQIVKILENQGFIHCATFTNQKNLNSDLFQSPAKSNGSSQSTTKNHVSTVNQNLQEHVTSQLIIIALKYIGREKKPIIHSLKRISKPSLRWYSANPIPQSLGGLGIFIVSTSGGIMTDKEARTKKLGGEILLEVW